MPVPQHLCVTVPHHPYMTARQMHNVGQQEIHASGSVWLVSALAHHRNRVIGMQVCGIAGQICKMGLARFITLIRKYCLFN